MNSTIEVHFTYTIDEVINNILCLYIYPGFGLLGVGLGLNEFGHLNHHLPFYLTLNDHKGNLDETKLMLVNFLHFPFRTWAHF